MMPANSLDVDHLAALQDCEVHSVVCRFVQILQERQRCLTKVALHAHALSELEEPQTESVPARRSLQRSLADE